MTDNETTPEYGAWVEARRTAVEAQRADLEAAIRRLEESLAEARQDLLDFDGENYLSVGRQKNGPLDDDDHQRPGKGALPT